MVPILTPRLLQVASSDPAGLLAVLVVGMAAAFAVALVLRGPSVAAFWLGETAKLFALAVFVAGLAAAAFALAGGA